MKTTKSLKNEITVNKFSGLEILVRQFKNPLLLIFIISTIISYLVGQKTEALAIWLIMIVSVLLGFWNEYRAEKVVNDLIKQISFTARIIRDGIKQVIPVRDVTTSDIAVLYPGCLVPADIKLSDSQNLEVNESVLTGESFAVAKKVGDTVYMGTVITGGTGNGQVIEIGMDTKLGRISKDLNKARPQTEFQKGLRDFSGFLAKIAVVTVALIIVLNFFLRHPMVETLLFALTVAMGITPELLPLIVTISLSFGAKKLAKENVIVKQFVSIEDLGNMEVLCTDKTGTLTEGKIVLNSYLNMKGVKDDGVLELSLICNAAFIHNGIFGDSIDTSILEYAKVNNFKVKQKFEKLLELPFNFENRFMSTVVKMNGKKLLICKGSPEAILERSALTEKEKLVITKKINDMQTDGFRVIGVATKELKEFNPKLIKSETTHLDFQGILSFSDVPKKDLSEAFEKFKSLGVAVKIITGDNEIVAEKISREVGFSYKNVLVSSQIDKMNDEALQKAAWETDIFARITPSQKVRIILSLKKGDHTIGYLGDGVNDGPALHNADVGISVNTAVDVAKDAASIVLLKKSLIVIADGIREGRKTFQNTIKYILMGTSSDFGNMVSAAAASVVLPFLPMTPVQFLLNDILYDVSQTSIPTDNVDPDQLLRPKSWDINYIKRFMLIFGSIGTIYDFLTFGIMYFIFKARGGFFQTGWFVTSFITEVLVVFVIRTRKIPFFKSRPSLPFTITCLGVVAFALYIPFSPIANYLGFVPLPPVYFVFLIVLSVTYLLFVEIGKYFLNKQAISNSR